MVNWVEAQKPLLHWLIGRAGLRPQTVELNPGTVMSFWVPKAAEEEKPAVVLVHGFASDGLVTWQFQIGALTDRYRVYVPDLLFFGGSATDSADRSPSFQAECLAAALDRLGVLRCGVVGFSYGGMVAFKLAERRPELVRFVVVSGSVFAMTNHLNDETMEQLGMTSSAELLLPESVEGLKALLSVAAYKRLWFPDFLHRDFLEALYHVNPWLVPMNKLTLTAVELFSGDVQEQEAEDRAAGLLEALVIDNRDAKVPSLPQRILLLWGENDNIFNLKLAKKMKEQLGEKAELRSIEKAGHLVHIERPWVYNSCLKEYLAFVHAEDDDDN